MPPLPIVLRVVPVLDFGGVESRLLLQADLAAEENYAYHVCALGRCGAAAETLRLAGIPVHPLETGATIGNPLTTYRLACMLRWLQPAVVHASIVEANFHSIVAALFSKRPQRLIVEEVGIPGKGGLGRWSVRHLYGKPDVILGVTDAVCEYLKSEDKAPGNKVRRVYNCAHPRFFPSIPVGPTRKTTETFQFLHIGRLDPVKNQANLIDAFETVVAKWPSARLTIVGDGKLRDSLERRTRSRRLENTVTIRPFTDDVLTYIDQAHAFVLPSWSEGCSISLIEAMARGKIVAGSNVPGIVEVLGTKYAESWTFSPSDTEDIASTLLKIKELSSLEYERLAELLQRRAYQHFSPAAYMRRLREIYFENR